MREILPWRELYRQEMNCQIVHDSLHGREGWTSPYLIESDGEPAGYGSIAVGGPWAGTRTIFEFYVAEKQRARFFEAFEALRDGQRRGCDRDPDQRRNADGDAAHVGA